MGARLVGVIGTRTPSQPDHRRSLEWPRAIDSGEYHALKYLSRSAYMGPDREVAILRTFQAHPHQNLLKLLEAYPPSLPSRPQWVVATAEADCNLRVLMMRHGSALRQGGAIMARGIGSHILQGIRHMHHFRVLHRDLKPDNLLVFFDLPICSPAPSPESLTAAAGAGVDAANAWKVRVQIADFSRARELPENATVRRTRFSLKAPPLSTVAAMSVMVCTRNYAAPELIAEDYDAKHSYGAGVDLWSFGCIFFELIAGEIFAPGRNFMEILAWWQLRLGQTLPEPLCMELGIDLKRVARTAEEIRERHPLGELNPGKVLAEPWLSQTLIYEAKGRRTASALLSSWLGDELLPKRVGTQPWPSSGPASSRGCESVDAAVSFTRGGAATPSSTSRARSVGSPNVARVMISGLCKCSGNCVRRNEHRRDFGTSTGRRSGCPSNEVHQVCMLCDECKCKVPTCFRPGCRSVYCSVHLRVFEAVAWPLQAAIAMGTLAEPLLPADVTDLREHASEQQTRADLAAMITIALVKEPSATAVLARSGCLAAMADNTRSATDVATLMSNSLDNVEVQKMSECSELGAQGVCRFTGYVSTLKRLGIIKLAESDPSPRKRRKRGPSSSRGLEAEESGPGIVRLGVLRQRYQKTGDASTLERFLNACRAEQGAWTSVLEQASIEDAIDQIDRIMTKVAAASRVLQAEAGGYVRKFVARKLLMVCLWEGALDTTKVWSQISVEKLDRIMPDQTAYLTPIPKRWSCEELSYFVFGRGDMVLYVSMYACLWKGVERSTTPAQQSAIITSAMRGGCESEFGKQAAALFAETGHQCTPKTIIASMIQNGKL